MANGPEKLRGNSENSAESIGEKAAAEQHEALSAKYERKETLEDGSERQAEKAKSEALEKAVSVESSGVEKHNDEPSGGPARRGPISKKDRNASYKKTMSHIQSEMPPVNRAFSKAIHNPVVEKTSEVVGSTIARPNAIAAGAISAFVVSFLVYMIARYYGYPLSGFETIGSFIVGWILGILFDYFKVMITGKK